jgi:Flp pilus assembly protein TadD
VIRHHFYRMVSLSLQMKSFKSSRSKARYVLLCAAAALGAVLYLSAPPAHSAENGSKRDLLWQHRNLGKAFYENPDTHLQAVTELQKALVLDPGSVRERINYGLALLRAGKTDAGVAELLSAQKQDLTLPHTWFNLGIVYKHAGDYANAIAQLEGFIRLVPSEPVGHYNLGAVLRAKGDSSAALTHFLEAEKLNPDLAGPHFQLFTAYQRGGDREAAARERKAFDEVKKRTEGAAVPEDMEWCFYAELYDPPDPRPAVEDIPRYDNRAVSNRWDLANTNLLLLDTEGTGHTDVLVWSADRVELLKSGVDKVAASGLESLRGLRNIAAGDFDNDGLTDLVVVAENSVTLFRNVRGKFLSFLELPNGGHHTQAIWLDFDHDNDLDLLLLGPQSALMRNNGNGKFEDHTSSFPFVNGNVLDAATYAIRSDTAARDLVVSYADHPAVLYRDKLNGIFEPADLPELPAGSSSLDIQDFNHDGLLDIASYRPQPHGVQNNWGRFATASGIQPIPNSLRGDFNADGREDYVRLESDGTLHTYLNSSPEKHWLSVRIKGVKNLKEAAGATVEMKSSAYYDKRIYREAPLTFAVDGKPEIDTIRITWPNGLIQNETNKKNGELLQVEEAQRLSGSCPMIFTWNGGKFQFITDVLGVAPLGASSGDGTYFPVDHDEYIQIPGSALKAENGQFQIHITEELHEVSYLDKVQLIALDHPTDVSIYTNDKFKSPPYPEFRLFGSRDKVHPVTARDDHGNDIRSKLQAIDHQYPDRFVHDQAGRAEAHTLDLDFGKAAASNRAALILNGWVDWADGSTFLAASQDGKGGLVFPYLQVKDKSGRWQTVVQDMGIPSGKPKTIVVDLTGKFLSDSREVRIVTNLCVYWDEIFLIDDAGAPQVHMTPLIARSADVHFRGFSRAVIDPSRQQPERFLYDQVQPISNWNPTPGLYTRYGDVQPLVTDADDRMVIMGSGDELSLQFPATDLSPLPSGWSRDFLLLVDGWAKDADANTAFSQSINPLPFHGMSSYPYRPGEAFPTDPLHQQYIRDYLTRPALRLIRPVIARRMEPAN